MSMTDPLIGKKLGDYNIEGVLGTGGMARVYRGYDDNLDRYAAIKVIEPQLIASVEEDEYRERFLREARAIARLNHPQIVSIYQFNQIGTLYYIAMEYAEGDNLRDVLKGYIRQGLIMPTSELLVVLSDIADALDYAHSQDIIHRDVKPSNVIMSQTKGAVLTDFGLALNAMEGTIGNTFGSVHYIAPEQAISSAQSVPASDQYSLGIVAYELLTGRVPFDDASAMSVALKHISDPPPPPTELNPNIPAEVEQVLMRALDKEPTKRYPSAKEFVRAMELAFNMMDNADIEAPKTLTEAVGAPPETTAFPPTDDSSAPKVPEASRPSLEGLTARSNTGRNGFIIGAIVVIAILLGGYYLFTTINEQNQQATETAEAIVAATGTQERVLIIAQNETSTESAQETTIAATQIAGASSTAIANANNTATALANQTATASANQTAEAIAVEQTQVAIESATAEAIANANATSTMQIRQTQTANDTATAQAAQITPTNTERATQTPSVTPSPTITSSPTITPSPTATATNTPLPTSTPTPDFFIISEDDTQQILLRYDGRSLVVSNRDTIQRLNLGDLRFVLFEPDEDGIIRETQTFDLDGSALENNARNMIPQRCLQILDSAEYSALPSPNLLADDLCSARPFWLTTTETFWLSTSRQAYFEVRVGPVDVIGQCEVQRPLTRTENRCALDINFLP